MSATDSHPNDAQLVVAYRGGDERSFELLVRRHLPSIHRFLVRMTFDPAVAEDLTQETFLKAWRYLDRFDTAKPFTTWLYTIAKNTLLDFLKKKRAVPFSQLDSPEDTDQPFDETLEDQESLPSVLAERAELGKELSELLARLPEAQRLAVVLHETEELTFREIAEVTGDPLDTVKSRYRRGMLAMRKELLKKDSF